MFRNVPPPLEEINELDGFSREKEEEEEMD